MSPYEHGRRQMQIAAYERDTGKRVACISGVDSFNAGLCLRASLANRYECDVDDLRFEEGSDGNDYITTPNGDVLRVEW
jgi:hypothetical protein